MWQKWKEGNILGQPLVYIVLLNYNGWKDTIDCVQSLKKVNYDNFETIIVDNFSMDDSLIHIRENCKEEIILESKTNLGFAGGNNIGIQYALDAKADYVLLLNNDTTVEPDFLDELVKAAEQDKRIGAVGGKIYYYDNPDTIWYAGAKINTFTGKTRHIGVDERDNGQYDKMQETGYITGCLMLLKAEVIRKVGLMDDRYFLYYEETDWNVRIRQHGYKIVYAPKAVIYHKVSSSTKKINYVMKYYYYRNVVYFINKNFNASHRVFMFFYIRAKLLIKGILLSLLGRREAFNVIKKAYRSIIRKEMGEYRP